MGLSLNPEHLKRYKDIAVLLWKHGRSDVVRNAGLDKLLDDGNHDGHVTDGSDTSQANELVADLERLGPIYIKLGQVLSSRTDLLPPEYIQALAKLHDDVEPFPFAQVEEIVQEELGVRISKGFSEFESQPIAAASLGQVHLARLRDGTRVAVKVQRPDIRKQIAADMEALEEIAEFLDHHSELGRRFQLRLMLQQFRSNLIRELDYRQELQHLQQIGTNLKDFDRIVVPRPYPDYSTGRVLTMEYLAGTKINSLGPLAPLEKNTRELADQAFRAYMKQILVDGIFHADPHAGNVLLTHDGRLALIDMGMIGYVSPTLQSQLLRLLLAVSEGRSDEAAEVTLAIGEKLENFDRVGFTRDLSEVISRQRSATVSEMQVGRTILEVVRIGGDHGIRTPPEFTMLGKTLLNLDEVGRSLDPHFDPNDAIRRYSAETMRQRTMKEATSGNLFATALEMRDFVEALPRRVTTILDKVANDELKVNVEAIDENALISGFEKVANRIATGLVLAALIIGAAQLMRIPTAFTIFGYPGLAILLFLAAAAGGFALVINIALKDRGGKVRKK